MSHYLRRWGWVWLMAIIIGVLAPMLWTQAAGWQALPPAQGDLSLGEQSGLVLAVYGFKLVYMLLASGLLIFIWPERGAAWRALWGSLAAFWLGEFFCWINILFYEEESLTFEYLHSLFMVFCVGLLFYSAMEAVDRDLLHFSDPKARCALSGVCKECVKAHPDTPGACLLHRLFKWSIPLGAVLAFMPLMAQPVNYSFATRVFGLPRTLTHLMPVQWFELRYSPMVALLLLAGSWAALVWQGHRPAGMRLSKVLLSGAMGLLGFSFMRLALAAFYQQGLVWFIFWEELTELLLIVGVLVVVLLIRPGRVSRLWARIST